MSLRQQWSTSEVSDADAKGSNGTDTRTIVWWTMASVVALALLMVLYQCWKRRRIMRRAQLESQDAVLNLPIATPWEASAVPYAQVVDTAATAPDHDELLPATEPALHLQRR